VHDERRYARARHHGGEVREELVVIARIDTDAALHRHGQLRALAHALDALGDQLRKQHQTGTEGSALHAVAGTSHVQVDLIEPRRRADTRRRRELERIGAAELERNGMLGRVVCEQPGGIAPHDRSGHDHLGVEKRVRRIEAMQVTAMTVGPIHHRRDA